MSEPQIFYPIVTPRQRVVLHKLCRTDVAWLQGQEERARYGRLFTALALDEIKRAIVRNADPKTGLSKTSAAQTNSNVGAEFILTLENVEFLLGVLLERIPISSGDLEVLAPLLDELVDVRRGKEVARTGTPFDRAADAAAWNPPV